MLMTGAPSRSRNVPREDLHVAGEHDEVDLAGEELEHPLLGLAVGRARDRDVVERHAEAGDVVRVVGVVGDDGDDVGVELAAAPAPEQVEEAVVVARGEERHALALARVGEAPVHRERPADVARRTRARARRGARARLVEPELHAHEERAALGVGRVLVGAEDVGVALGEEARDRGDDPVPVGARDEQAGDVLTLVLRQQSIKSNDKEWDSSCAESRKRSRMQR